MTLQSDRRADVTTGPPALRWRSRRIAGPVTAVAILVGAAVAAAFVVAPHTGEHPGPADRVPEPVLGSALAPLNLHAVVSRFPDRDARPGELRVTGLGQPDQATILAATADVALHVRYARVRPVGTRWHIDILAPEAATFNLAAARGRSYEAVVGTGSLAVLFTPDSPDGTNYDLIGGVPGLTQDQATRIARSLTTSVAVSQCTQADITANRCA